jgi:hypothetical protein
LQLDVVLIIVCQYCECNISVVVVVVGGGGDGGGSFVFWLVGYISY